MGALSALPWCVLSMLCNTAHVNTMSLTTLGLCSMVASSTLNWLTKIPGVFNHPPASGDPEVGHSFFESELSSAVGFHHPWHQGKGVVTLQKVMQIWSSLSGSGAGSPKLPSLIFSLNSLLLKICASDEEPLDPQSIHMNLNSTLTRARSTREKKPL